MGDGVLLLERGTNVFKLGLGVFFAHELEDGECFVNPVAGGGPARAAGNAEQESEEDDGGDSGDADLPAPLGCAEMHGADDVVGGVGDHDAEDDVELKGADETAAPLGRGQLGDVDRAEDRGGADAESADEAEDHEGGPAPGQAAADGGDDIEDGGDAEGFAAAEPLA